MNERFSKQIGILNDQSTREISRFGVILSKSIEVIYGSYFAKPLSVPMLAYCQLDSWEQISVKFESEF